MKIVKYITIILAITALIPMTVHESASATTSTAPFVHQAKLDCSKKAYAMAHIQKDKNMAYNGTFNYPLCKLKNYYSIEQKENFNIWWNKLQIKDIKAQKSNTN